VLVGSFYILYWGVGKRGELAGWGWADKMSEFFGKMVRIAWLLICYCLNSDSLNFVFY